MINIKLLCVSGMLSSIILGKVKDAARLREIDADVQSLPEGLFDKTLKGTDVVLIGPQIAYKLPKIKEFCDSRGIASGVIGMREYGLMDGDAILKLAIKLSNEMKENIKKAEEEKELKEREEKEKAAREEEERIIREEQSKKAENEKQEDKIKEVVCEENSQPEKNTENNIVEDIQSESAKQIAATSYEQLRSNSIESYLEGYEDMIKKAKELILSAEKEIYLSTNIDLELFQDEFMEASQRGVRITVVSLSEYKGEDLQVDKLYTYIDERDKRKNSKIMMTVDGGKALVADENVNSDGILDVITDNILLASVVDKNIKNYIYLLKLRDNIAFKLKDN